MLMDTKGFFFFFFEEWTPAFIVPVFIIILSNSSAKLPVEYKYIFFLFLLNLDIL